MINSIATVLLCTFAAQSGDQTVLSTAERFFFRDDFQQAAALIDSHTWVNESLWSRAGLFRELCDEGFSIECPVMNQYASQQFNTSVSILLTGEFQTGDSVRIILPVAVELPWQTFAETADVSFSGIEGAFNTEGGWLVLQGRSSGFFEISVSQQVSIDPTTFPGVISPGSEEAMVPYPGEDSFLDRCLDTDVFWAGGDALHLESSLLAAGEPNPMVLVARVIDAVSVFYRNSNSVVEQILLYPVSELTLQNQMQNSLGGASLGAAVLRRWQIPALVVPGRWGEQGSSGFLLAAYVKPFGWMVISPFPQGFTAMGSFDPPAVHSWFNGLSGITFHAEYLGSDGLWHAIPVESSEFTHNVEILIL
ncbi:MAG: hypothetical protein KAH31_05920 [Candidatus Sabulitectum sp.]|nr:hypothetical protein [Candidatus Sabulitectum sp.]